MNVSMTVRHSSVNLADGGTEVGTLSEVVCGVIENLSTRWVGCFANNNFHSHHIVYNVLRPQILKLMLKFCERLTKNFQ